MIPMDDRGYVANALPHGTPWSRGLELAEAEIGRGPEPSGRWSRKAVAGVPAGSGVPTGPAASDAERTWPPDAWTPETGPADRGTGSVGRESWAAQAA